MGYRNLIELLVFAATALIFGRVLVSWVDPMGRNEASRFLFRATEPILAPVRRVLPSTGMVDFSPFVVLIVLGVVVRALGL